MDPEETQVLQPQESSSNRRRRIPPGRSRSFDPSTSPLRRREGRQLSPGCQEDEEGLAPPPERGLRRTNSGPKPKGRPSLLQDYTRRHADVPDSPLKLNKNKKQDSDKAKAGDIDWNVIGENTFLDDSSKSNQSAEEIIQFSVRKAPREAPPVVPPTSSAAPPATTSLPPPTNTTTTTPGNHQLEAIVEEDKTRRSKTTASSVSSSGTIESHSRSHSHSDDPAGAIPPVVESPTNVCVVGWDSRHSRKSLTLSGGTGSSSHHSANARFGARTRASLMEDSGTSFATSTSDFGEEVDEEEVPEGTTASPYTSTGSLPKQAAATTTTPPLSPTRSGGTSASHPNNKARASLLVAAAANVGPPPARKKRQSRNDGDTTDMLPTSIHMDLASPTSRSSRSKKGLPPRSRTYDSSTSSSTARRNTILNHNNKDSSEGLVSPNNHKNNTGSTTPRSATRRIPARTRSAALPPRQTISHDNNRSGGGGDSSPPTLPRFHRTKSSDSPRKKHSTIRRTRSTASSAYCSSDDDDDDDDDDSVSNSHSLSPRPAKSTNNNSRRYNNNNNNAMMPPMGFTQSRIKRWDKQEVQQSGLLAGHGDELQKLLQSQSVLQGYE